MARPRGGFGSRFFFQPAIPGRGIDPNDKIVFEAHITAVNTSAAPSWNRTNDSGRPDPKVFYGSYNGSFNCSFMVVSTNRDEHTENYENLRRLAILTNPITVPGLGYVAPHVKFRVADLISAYGYVENVDYSWNGEGVWIDGKPIVTEVNISIPILTNGQGKRPNYQDGDYNYFGV